MERLDLSGSARYSAAELSIHAVRYLPVRDLVRGARVLDIACGQGLGAFLMKRHWGAAEVVGVDLSPDAIRLARRSFAEPGLQFHEADAEAFLKSRRGRFDVVTCVETIEHLPNPSAVLPLLRRAVGKGGLIYMTCPNDEWYFGAGESLNPHHRSTWSAETFFEQCEPDLGLPRRRYLGTVASGFAMLPWETGSASSMQEAVRMIGPATIAGCILPAPADAPDAVLTPEQSLFYAGLWAVGDHPGLAENGTGDAFCALWPAAPGFRQPMIGAMPDSFVRHPDRAVLILAAAGDERGRAEARSLQAALSTRLAAEIIATGEDVAASVLPRIMGPERPNLVHCVGAGLAFALLREVPVTAMRRGYPPESVARRLGNTLLTFSAFAEDTADAAFWGLDAPYFDGLVADRPEVIPSELRHRSTILEAGSEATRDAKSLAATWLRILRRAEAGHRQGIGSIRAAAIRAACGAFTGERQP